MNYFQRERQDWIKEMLEVYGFINREHLMRKFRISKPLASNDLGMFSKFNKDKVFYNLSNKRYETRK